MVSNVGGGLCGCATGRIMREREQALIYVSMNVKASGKVEKLV